MNAPSARVPPRIGLLVVSSDLYPPSRVDVSVLFGEELAGRGHRFDWLLQSEASCDRDYVTPWGGGQAWVGATDLGTSLFARIRKHMRSVVHDLKLFGLLRRGSHAGIEVKDKFLSGLLAIVAARLFHKRFIYWLSYPFPEEYLSRSRDRGERYAPLYAIRGRVFSVLLYRVLLPAADHVFVQSRQMLHDVAAHGIPEHKMTAVPMGVKMARDASPPAVGPRGIIPAGEPCFLYLGSLAKVRHIEFLVRVLAAVRRVEPRTRLYLVGKGNDPGDEAMLTAEAEKLGVRSALVLTGQLPQSEAFRYVRDADVCVSPFFPVSFLNSTSPTKLVEYLAMGKAVVANDHPEQKLVLEESGAGLCVPYQVEPFASAVVELLRDAPRAARMGRQGWEYVLRHRSYPVIADAVEASLQRVLGGVAS